MITDLKKKLDRLASTPIQQAPKKKHDISAVIGAECVQKENGGYLLRRIKYAVGAIYGDYTLENVEKTFGLKERLLFLDTETTGLGSVACPFLIGISYFDENSLVLEQYFMRDIDDEACVLEEIVKKYSGMTVVSYNGKSFDVPLIKARCTLNAVNCKAFATKQSDLLHLCRRIWKKRLENCRLSTIEEEILKLKREDDIPGSEIPEMYKRYLESGNGQEMLKVIEHNESDVVSMSVILCRLIRIFGDPVGQLDDIRDVMHLGESYYAKKDFKRSLECFGAALKGSKDAMTSYNCMKYISFIHKKNKEYSSAVELWQKMERIMPSAVLPLEELAKYYEHVQKDIAKALECANKARKNALLSGAKELRAQLDRRIERLNKKRGAVDATSYEEDFDKWVF